MDLDGFEVIAYLDLLIYGEQIVTQLEVTNSLIYIILLLSLFAFIIFIFYRFLRYFY